MRDFPDWAYQDVCGYFLFLMLPLNWTFVISIVNCYYGLILKVNKQIGNIFEKFQVFWGVVLICLILFWSIQ